MIDRGVFPEGAWTVLFDLVVDPFERWYGSNVMRAAAHDLSPSVLDKVVDLVRDHWDVMPKQVNEYGEQYVFLPFLQEMPRMVRVVVQPDMDGFAEGYAIYQEDD